MKDSIIKLKTFLILWSTQALSQLGSAMTNFALTLWLYEKTGSALKTAGLMICSYAPYVLTSIFAGALSDRWDKKRTMLVCDTFAALCTVSVLVLLETGRLRPVHMYLLNALNGLMNTVQEPASDVAMTLITPKAYYQKTSGLKSFSRSLNTILCPLIATALFAAVGLRGVIFVDLASFAVAFSALLFFVKIPKVSWDGTDREAFTETVRSGLHYLRETPMILMLMLFLAGVNLVASAFDAVLPAFILPNPNGGERILGIVTAFSGVAMLIGSFVVTLLPAPKNRIRVISLTMLFSLGTENFLLALTRSPILWCFGQIIGWILVPVMNANLDVVFRTTIPTAMQGRVYACRNSFQFFTIPLGYFLGGLLVDHVFEPLMARVSPDSLPGVLFGTGKGSGAGAVIFILGISGVLICLIFGRILRRYRFEE